MTTPPTTPADPFAQRAEEAAEAHRRELYERQADVTARYLARDYEDQKRLQGGRGCGARPMPRMKRL